MKDMKKKIPATIAALMAAVSLFAPPAYAGWVNDGGGDYYVQDDGAVLTNTMTPDGFYVDGNGKWFQEHLTILGEDFTSPQKFTPMNRQTFEYYLAVVNGMNTRIQNAAPGRRAIHLYRDGMSLCAVENQKETPLLVLSEDTVTGGYRLRISTNLGSGGFVDTDLRTYDYEVFRFMCAVISNRPSILADAIYQSWQRENRYGINMVSWAAVADTMVMVEVVLSMGLMTMV